MKTWIILVGILLLLLGREFGASAGQVEESTLMQIKALQIELLTATDPARQIEIKTQILDLVPQEEVRVPAGHLDQGGESCLEATLLTGPIPIVISGTTSGFANDYSVLGVGPLAPPCWEGYYDEILTANGPDVVYQFFPPVEGIYRISLCNSDFDTGLLIYNSNCPPTNPVDLICGNDDYCGVTSFQSEVSAIPLSPSQPVYIVVDGWNGSEGNYTLEIDFAGGGSPANDNCSGAQFVEPFSPVTGNTTLATLDTIPDCGTSISAPGVWFVTTGTGNTMTAHTCFGASYDTRINVYTGDCAVPVCVTGDDDGCGLQSSASWCSVAGQVYFILVQGFSGQTGFFTFVVEDDGVPCSGPGQVYTIPEIYANLQSMVGQDVTVQAQTTTAMESLLVDVYGVYMLNEKMPPYFMLRVVGPYISPPYWNGVLVEVTGVVDYNPTAEPGYELLLVTNAPGPAAVPVQPTSVPPSLPNWRTNWVPGATCDTCNFAILISGGVDANNNHADYWDDLVDFYCYKRTHNYCESRTKVFYFDGNRPAAHSRRTEIPTGVISSATQANILAHINSISAQVAACKRAGRKPMVEVVVSNHGKKAPNGGINLFGAGVLSPATFTSMMQKLADSSATTLDIEMGQCYGAQMINHLRDNLVPRGTNVTAASAAPDSLQSFSKRGDGGYNYWLNEKVCNLAAGKNIQQAINRANTVYDSIMTPLASYCGDWARYWDGRGQPGTGTAWRSCSTDAARARGGESYLRSFCLPKRCQSDTIQVTKGGRITLTFSGPTKSCGNCEIVCQDTLGRWIRQSQWNWNVPGSAGYMNGQNTRRIDSAGASNGIYVVHSRSDTFYVKAVSQNPPLPPALETSPSNPQDFSGFAIGWTTGTSDEFGNIATNSYTIADVDEDGFDLSTAPKIIGPGGVETLTANYTIPAVTYWWQNMQVYVGIINGVAGTEIFVETPGYENTTHNALLSGGTEEVVFGLGAAQASGAHSLQLFASGPIELDYWGLESGNSTGTPPAVTNLTILRSGNDIQLFWSAVPVAANYRVQSSPGVNGPWTTLVTVGTPNYTIVNQAIAPETQVYYQVIAVGP